MTKGSKKDDRPANGGAFDVKYTPPSYVLKAKSPPTGRPIGDALADADAAVSELAEDYPQRAQARIAELEAAHELTQNPRKADEACDTLFAIALDIRGQSGTFGFPLATEIAASLCAMLEANLDTGSPPHEAIRVHIAALKLVMSTPIKGDGGAQGAELLRGLEKVSATDNSVLA